MRSIDVAELPRRHGILELRQCMRHFEKFLRVRRLQFQFTGNFGVKYFICINNFQFVFNLLKLCYYIYSDASVSRIPDQIFINYILLKPRFEKSLYLLNWVSTLQNCSNACRNLSIILDQNAPCIWQTFEFQNELQACCTVVVT